MRLFLVIGMLIAGLMAPLRLATANGAATDSGGLWGTTDRALATTPLGNRAVVSCHNCYVSSSGNSAAANLSATLAKIHAAQSAGADMIEIDVKSQNGITFVAHEDDSTTNLARLSDVLNDAGLRSGNQLLAVELKETTTSAAFVDDVLTSVHDYARLGRPVLIKAFTGLPLNNLKIVHDDLGVAYSGLSPYVRTAVLYPANNWSLLQFRQSVQSMRDAGYQAVDLEITTPGLPGVIEYAKSIGFGVGLWTFPTGSEAIIAALREQADFLTTDVPIATTRALVTANNVLSFVDVADQNGANGSVLINEAAGAVTTAPVNGGTNPILTTDPTGTADLTGHYLRFVSANRLHMALYDLDNTSTGGYIVSTVATFENLALSRGATAVLVGKADAGGFTLELAYPAGTADAVLRFGVYINGAYRYATYPASQLKLGTSYVLTGAYSGRGTVRLWVANSTSGVTPSATYTGAVGVNDVPAMLGADPQGDGSTTSYFDGKIQAVSVLSWSTVSDTVVPVVTLTAPIAGATVSGLTTLTASATDASAVTEAKWYVDGGQVAWDGDGPPFSATWNSGAKPDGPHSMFAKVSDAFGNWGTSTTVDFRISNDTATTTTTTTIPPTSTTTTMPATSTTSTTAAPPPRDTLAPLVTLTAPIAGATVSGLTTLTVSATDASAVTQAKWYVDGSEVAWDGDGPPFAATWNSGARANGQHTMFGKARDAAGNWGTSTTINFTISN